MLDALDGETHSADAVHRGRGAALLNVAGDCEAGFEAAFAFLADHVRDNLGGVGGAGVLVVEDEFAGTVLALVGGEALAEVVDVAGEHVEVDAFFGGVYLRSD